MNDYLGQSLFLVIYDKSCSWKLIFSKMMFSKNLNLKSNKPM